MKNFLRKIISFFSDNHSAGENYYSRDRIRSGIVYYLCGRGITSLSVVLVPLLLVRTLTVYNYASFTAFSGLLMFIVTVSDVGFERVIPRYLPELRNTGAEYELKLVCRWVMFLKVGLLIVFLGSVVFLYDFLVVWFNLPADIMVLRAFILYAFSFSMSFLITAALQSLMLQKQVVIGMALDGYIKLFLLFTILVVQGRLNLFAVLLIHGCSSTIGMLYMFWKLEQHMFHQKNSTSCNSGTGLCRKQIINTGIQNYLWQLSNIYLSPSVVKLISASFFSTGTTAALGFAYAVVGMVQRFLPATFLKGIIEPTIMAKYTDGCDSGQSQLYLSIVLKTNLIVLIPFTCWFFLSGDIII